MTIKLYTEKEVKILSKNLYIKSVSPKEVTYTDEFKCIFSEENEKGKPSRIILKQADLM